MKKKSIKIIIIFIIIIIILSVGLFYICRYYNGFYTANFKGEKFVFRGDVYVQSHYGFSAMKLVGKTPGNWKVYGINDDEEYNFLVAKQWTSSFYYMKEDYIIPTSGELTAVMFDSTVVDDEEFCQAIENIINSDGYTFETDEKAIYDQIGDIFLRYNDCPVYAIKPGKILYIKETWVFIKADEYLNLTNENQFVTCRIIDEEYIAIIERYINDDGYVDSRIKVESIHYVINQVKTKYNSFGNRNEIKRSIAARLAAMLTLQLNNSTFLLLNNTTHAKEKATIKVGEPILQGNAHNTNLITNIEEIHLKFILT